MADRKVGADFARRNVIYLITCNVNGKLYVGQTRELLWDRWRGHRNAATGKPEQSYSARTAIARAMRKYGVDCFVLSVLEICASADDLDAREAHWIAELGTLRPHGYNLTGGGNTAPRTPEVGAAISAANKGRVKTPEWRAKLSAAHKGKIISVEQRAGISARHRGSKHSEETKRRRSLALKGRKRGPCSPERRAAILAGMTSEGRQRTIAGSVGKKRSEETKAKLRAAWVIRKKENRQVQPFKGRKHTAEAKAKMGAWQRGKKCGPYSVERRANISAALKGRKPSDAERAAMRAAWVIRKEKQANGSSTAVTRSQRRD